jgi:hypothetical protein
LPWKKGRLLWTCSRRTVEPDSVNWISVTPSFSRHCVVVAMMGPSLPPLWIVTWWCSSATA